MRCNAKKISCTCLRRKVKLNCGGGRQGNHSLKGVFFFLCHFLQYFLNHFAGQWVGQIAQKK